jgi:hypothetical protein
MKLIRSTIAFIAVLTLFSACTKVDVPVENELTPGDFPKTQAQFILASGTAYAKFRDSYATSYWQAQSLSTDEAVLPTRGSNWYDGGRYQEMHYHSGHLIMRSLLLPGHGVLVRSAAVTRY